MATDAGLEKAYQALRDADADDNKELATSLVTYIENYKPVKSFEPVAPIVDEESYLQQLSQIPSLIPELIENSWKKVDARVDNMGKTFGSLQSGALRSTDQAAVQLAGQAAGGVVDVIAETAGGILKTASLLIPDSIEKPIAETLKSSVNAVLNTEVGAKALQALEGGMGKYEEMKKSDPELFKTIESAINIPLILLPSLNASPVKGVLSNTGKKLITLGEEGKRVSKAKFIDDLIYPEQTAKVAQAGLANTTVQGRFLQKAVVAQTPDEKDIAKLLLEIKGVGQDKTLKANWTNIRADLFERSQELKNQLVAADIGRLNSVGYTGSLKIEDVTGRLLADIEDLIATNPLINSQVPLQKAAQSLLDKTVQLLESKPLTPANVLSARQELDSFILKSKGTVFSALDENALSVPFKTLRTTLNNIIEEAVPSIGVKDSLRKQSLLYTSLDTIAPKAAAEAGGIVGRAVKNVQQVLPYNELRMFWLGGAVFATGYSFPQMLPYAAGALVLGGTGRALMGSALSSHGKVGLGRLIQGIDKAIKKSTNSAMRKQLHADRIYIADALKNLETDNSAEAPELLAR
jgi:hypothetical protein